MGKYKAFKMNVDRELIERVQNAKKKNQQTARKADAVRTDPQVDRLDGDSPRVQDDALLDTRSIV